MEWYLVILITLAGYIGYLGIGALIAGFLALKECIGKEERPFVAVFWPIAALVALPVLLVKFIFKRFDTIQYGKSCCNKSREEIRSGSSR